MLKGTAVKILAMILVMAFITGCSKKKREERFVAGEVGQLYNQGKARLARENYPQAAAYFDEVERQHPYSEWARRAQLMSAYSYYLGNDYEEAILAAERFLALHPGNASAPYAYYLIAISYYEQITDVGRDQKVTEQAMGALQQVVQRFPDTAYAEDARLKLDLTRDHLAGKEMEIGRYYQKDKQYLAALIRFKNVIDDYQTTTHVPEALHRLVEIYLALGIPSEAQQVASVLGHNFPKSKWYKYSYDLLTNPKRAKKVKASKKSVKEDYTKAVTQTVERASTVAVPREDKKAMKARQRQEMVAMRDRHREERKAVGDDKKAKKELGKKQDQEWAALRDTQLAERKAAKELRDLDKAATKDEKSVVEETEAVQEEETLKAEEDNQARADKKREKADKKKQKKSSPDKAKKKALKERQRQEIVDMRARHREELKAVDDDKAAKKALKEKHKEEWAALREAHLAEQKAPKGDQDQSP